MTNEDLTRLYNEANGIPEGKAPPITTERIFTAMRAAAQLDRTSGAWRKTCSCKGPSSTHQFRTGPVPFAEHGIPNTTVTRCAYYPQPSCDMCGAPWESAE